MALHVVLGATGGAGSSLVAELAGRGHEVRAVSRRAPERPLPPGVVHVAADVADREQARRAVAGAAVVHHAAQPDYTRWPDEFPALTRAIADAVQAAGAKLVLADNLYTYAPRAPLTEDGPEQTRGRKALVRRGMAEELLARHARGDLRVVLGRASDHFGPFAVGSAVGEPLVRAVLDGGRVRWPGRLDVPHAVSYLPDVARALATLGEDDRADGRTWLIPADAHTATEVVGALARAAGTSARPFATSALSLRVAGVFSPFLREFRETHGQWTQPWTIDGRAYARTFGPLEPTPLDAAAAATVAWWRGG